MTIITLFLILIFIQLLVIMVGAFLAWQKIAIFLTWNTQYNSAEYQTAITTPKIKRVPVPPSQTEQRGRAIKPVDDLVDLADMDFETAVSAIEQAAQ